MKLILEIIKPVPALQASLNTTKKIETIIGVKRTKTTTLPRHNNIPKSPKKKKTSTTALISKINTLPRSILKSEVGRIVITRKRTRLMTQLTRSNTHLKGLHAIN